MTRNTCDDSVNDFYIGLTAGGLIGFCAAYLFLLLRRAFYWVALVDDDEKWAEECKAAREEAFRLRRLLGG